MIPGITRLLSLPVVAIVATLAIPALPGCGPAGANGNGSDGRLHAVCTIGQVADLVRRIGGDHVRVTQLMDDSVDPHRYVATEADVRQLGAADVIFYNGMLLEGRMTDIFVRMARKVPTVPVSERIPDEKKATDEQDHPDPHIWFDVQLWMSAAEVVRDELVGLRPDAEADFRANAAQLLKEMEELDSWTREQIAAIPEGQRVLVTAHDAFGYFGRAYDIEVKAIQGISTADEASGAKIAALARFIAERKIKAVFVESTIPPDTIRSLIEACKGLGHTVRGPGDGEDMQLFSDAMGPAGSETGTYIGMVRHNVRTIVNALK